jgi:hypothetical protein
MLKAIVNQEMLHMCLAANALIAIGGAPAIYPTCIPPSWPSALPADVDNGLVVGIEAISNDVVFNTYMAIEAPLPAQVDQPSTGGPIPMPGKPPFEPGDFPTIGIFYEVIIGLLAVLPASDFGHADQQVATVFQVNTTVTQANFKSQLTIIINQGEGSKTSPVETGSSPSELAHFYAFAQIKMGKMIVVNSSNNTYAFTGAAITVDPAGVYDMPANYALSQIPTSSAAYPVALAFANDFDTVMQQLQTTFNGTPGELDAAIGSMFNLPGSAGTCMTTPFQNGQVTPLCFQVAPT